MCAHTWHCERFTLLDIAEKNYNDSMSGKTHIVFVMVALFYFV